MIEINLSLTIVVEITFYLSIYSQTIEFTSFPMASYV